MHPNAGVAAAASSLRVDIRRFPWINRLAADYAFDGDRLSPFFSGDVRDPQAWQQVIQLAPDSPEGQAAKRALDTFQSSHPGIGGAAQKPGT